MLSKSEINAALEERHGADIQSKLSAASVGIAGLGGLGSNVAVYLTRLGVGRLVLVDFDRVDITNLNRQHYFLPHIGQYKTDALKEQLLQINPYLKFETHTVRITSENVRELFSDCNIICEAFDKPDQKAMLVEAVLSLLPKIPIVSGSGMAVFAPANEIRTVKRLGRLYLCGDGRSDSEICGGLMAPRVAVCAAHEATAILRLILGESPI